MYGPYAAVLYFVGMLLRMIEDRSTVEEDVDQHECSDYLEQVLDVLHPRPYRVQREPPCSQRQHPGHYEVEVDVIAILLW